jgi:hypothetical protein
MTAPIRAPFLKKQDIREKAAQFLEKYNPENTIPVPLDDIVDLRWGITIAPVFQLQSRYDVVGFTSSDFKTIYVDADLYNNPRLEARYRFTLAHEMGHVVLHADTLRKAMIRTIDDYTAFRRAMPEGERSWFESHAYEFGGLILVPPEELERIAKERLESVLEIVERAKRMGWERDSYLEIALDKWANRIAPSFHVSWEVVQKRLNADGLVDLIE